MDTTNQSGNPRTAAYRSGGRGAATPQAPTRTVITGGKPNCVHHWVIEPPQVGVRGVGGTCKRCDAHRRFESASDGWAPELWNAGPSALANRAITPEDGDWRPADER